MSPPNAIFDADFVGLGWPHTAKEFNVYTLVIFGGVGLCGMVLVVLLGTALLSLTAAYLFVIVNIILSVIADFYGILDVENYISHQIDEGAWTDLPLSGLTGPEIVHAKYMIARIRMRRLILPLQALRAAPYIYLVFAAIVDFVNGGYVGSSGPSSFYFALSLLLTLPFAILLVRYEPRWQLNTIAALGLTTAMAIRTAAKAKLVGILETLLLRLSLAGILTLTGLVISSALKLPTDKAIESILLALLVSPIATFCIHIAVRLGALDRAVRLCE